MRKDITVTAELRGSRGKNEARRMRVSGKIPAVVYGASRQPVAVAVNPKDVHKILTSKSGHNTIFNLQIDGAETTPVMIADWQHDPIRSNLLHADLKRIDLNQRITVKVPVHTHGEPRGVKQQGGLLELVAREIEIECLPEEIPEEFVVDVTELLIGQNKRAGEIPMLGSMTLVSNPDTVLAHVVALRTSTTTEETAEAAAEPEVVKKGKKEEEGEKKPAKK